MKAVAREIFLNSAIAARWMLIAAAIAVGIFAPGIAVSWGLFWLGVSAEAARAIGIGMFLWGIATLLVWLRSK